MSTTKETSNAEVVKDMMNEAIEAGQALFREESEKLAYEIYKDNLTACGGNWVAMLWSGVKRMHSTGQITDEEYKQLDTTSDKLSKSDGSGMATFLYLDKMLYEIAVRTTLRKVVNDNENTESTDSE